MSETAPSWLHKNAFLVAAAGLPVVVMLFFLAATTIPQWTVEDPAHDVIFALTRYDRAAADIALEFSTENGRVMAVAKRVPENGYGPYQQLYRYHVRSGKLEALPVDVPDSVRQQLADATVIAGETPPQETFDPGVLDDLSLTANRTAPDGYEFVHDNSGHRGLFGELFGMGRRQAQVGLSKNGRLVKIEHPDSRAFARYHAVTFLAWVENES